MKYRTSKAPPPRRPAHQRGLLERVAFSGDGLRALRQLSDPISPLPDILDVEPSLHLLTGAPKCGKTSFALLLASAWCQRVAPWPGAPKLPGSPALIVSAEQSVRRIDRVLRRLTHTSGVGTIEGWTDHLHVVARSHNAPSAAEARTLLCLDDEGQRCLRELLREQTELGDPIGLLVLDSLSRLKPHAVEENSATDMSAWLNKLQELATEFSVYVFLIHHVGHADRDGAVSSARGSSSIGAVAQVAIKLGRVGNKPRQRRLQIAGNEVNRSSVLFHVSDETDPDPEHINFYHRDGTMEDELEQAMPERERMSARAVASAVQRARNPSKEPSGGLRETVKKTLEKYEGSIVQRDGDGWVRVRSFRASSREAEDLEDRSASEF